MKKLETAGRIFNIQKFSLHDGMGIRTTIFFKGCPLNCAWCCNPESKKIKPQILVSPDKCIKCRNCIKACKTGALTEDGRDKARCIVCGSCAMICPTGAREIAGREVTVGEVLKEVSKDDLFYYFSSGGVTFSGGEPLFQPEFAYNLAKAVKDNYINLAIETSGYADWQLAEPVLEQMDEILFDIKIMDPEKHYKYTGVRNELILENVKKSAKLGKKMVIRVPLIGGVNDDEKNIKSIAGFAAAIGINELHILPYHKLGETKYRKIGEKINTDFYIPEDDRVNKLLGIVRSFGITTRSGG